ncbi:MAG: NADH-quinone oxidoreductase subunit D [Crenarchaeota archaeon]|nr:NADH-quinone oxidoreductase subunit D [Thermoproteota archaeon]
MRLVDRVLRWAIGYSLWPVHLVTACCGVEFAHVFAPGFDAERHGVLPMPALRQCNIMIIEGTISLKMAKHVRLVYDQMPEPKYVIAMGSCASNYGVFSGSYHIVRACDVVPVDIYVPGCPPLPEAVLRAVVELQRKVIDKAKKIDSEEVRSRWIRFSLFTIEKVEKLSENERLISLIVGPQHPGSGHFRFVIFLEGDIIRDVEPDPGYVHRGVEKIAEQRHYISIIPMLERVSLTDPINIVLPYVHAVEKLLNIDVPERARAIRTLLAELSRIGTHLYDLGILSIMLGHSTGYMWCFEAREGICEIFSRYSGSRHAPTCIVPGGVRYEMRDDILRMVEKYVEFLERWLRSFKNIFVNNAAVKARLKDVGKISREDALKLNLVGPNLRASGVFYDARRELEYEYYGNVEFEVPVLDSGDALARMMIRILEIEQSMRIIRQIIKNMPKGSSISEDLLTISKELGIDVEKPNNVLRILARTVLPRGYSEAYVEAARGLTYVYVISRGDSENIYKMRIVTPSYFNLLGMMKAMIGYRLADVPAIYGSFGHFPPECDR